MRYVKILLLTAVVVCALSGASAQAALPEFSGTLPDSGTVKSTGPKLENAGSALRVTCTESEGSLEISTVKEGKDSELFLGCEATLSGVKLGKCTGLASTVVGAIFAGVRWLLGFLHITLKPSLAQILTELHFECPLGVLAVARGCVVGTTTLTKSLSGTLVFEGSEGVQKFTEYTNDKGETVSCKLESSVNGAAFGASDLVQTANLTFSKELEVKD